MIPQTSTLTITKLDTPKLFWSYRMCAQTNMYQNIAKKFDIYHYIYIYIYIYIIPTNRILTIYIYIYIYIERERERVPIYRIFYLYIWDV